MNRPYSEATVKLVADAVAQWCNEWRGELDPHRDAAVTALDALAAAGLLLPEGADDEDFSWGVRNEEGWVYQCGDRLDAESLIAARVKLSPHDPPGDLVCRRWAPTWESVDAVRLAVGDSKPSVQDPSVSVEETPQ